MQILGEAGMMGITHEIRRFLKDQYVTMMPVLNEKAKRIWAGSTARGLGLNVTHIFLGRADYKNLIFLA